MLGAGLQFGRTRGENRFYNPAKARRNLQNRKSRDPLRRAQNDIAVVSHSPSTKGNSVEREQESRGGPVEPPLPIATPVVSPLCNLERFLESVTPSIPAQYLSKTSTRERRTCDVEFQSYFVLGDLWESFKEWSAYGAGVPLILNDSDSVVQYYVPYLSAIQIYGYPSKCSVKSRRPCEDSDGDYFRDSSSDGSSDCEHDRSLTLREQQNHHCQGCLLLEYLEWDQPYGRVPLADKILDLALSFPDLKTLRSCDILSSSWISVAWYPIYRIPVGPTLEDLNACFLTFHSLDTPVSGLRRDQAAVMADPSEIDGVPMISLPVFGLASYRFKASRWTSNGGSEGQHLINSLLQAAEEWLTLIHVNHPDFLFFRGRRY